ncbi:MAG: tetratricopeptide repeat protein [Silicimonas sp.]|nr:tetratricopeptide repeat protein [Silicimonas sp.]
MPDFLTNDTFWGALSAIAAVVAALAAMGFFRKEQIVRGALYTVQSERDDLREKLARAEVRLGQVDPERFLDRIDGLEGDFPALEAEALGFAERQSEAFGRAAAIMAEQRLWDSDTHGGEMVEEALRFAAIGLAADPGSAHLAGLKALAERRRAGLEQGEPIEVLNWDGMSDVELNQLAISLKRDGKFALAEMAARRSVPLAIQRTGRASSNAAAIGTHGAALQDLEQFEAAEPLLRDALEITRKTEGARDPNTARALNNLALLYDATGRYGEAEPLLREALDIDQETLGAKHPDTITALNNLAALLRATDRVAEAEPLLREALETGRKVQGDQHPDTAQTLANLAALLHGAGRSAEADPLLREAIGIYGAALGAEHPATQGARESLSTLLAGRG